MVKFKNIPESYTVNIRIFLVFLFLIIFKSNINCSSQKLNTYINEEYQFFFQYPKKWVVENRSKDIRRNSLLILWIEFNTPKVGNITGIKLKIWDEGIDEYLNKSPENYQPYTINNINGYKGDLYESTFILLPLDDDKTLDFIYFCESYDEKSKELKEKIIFSLKYLN